MHMFAYDPESPVDKVKLTFMHPKLNGFWDWPEHEEDTDTVSAKFVFYGQCVPEPPIRGHGFKFPEEEDAKRFYRVFKNSLKN